MVPERAPRCDAQRRAESLAKKSNTTSVGVNMVLSPPHLKSWNIPCTSRWLDLGRDTIMGLFLTNQSVGLLRWLAAKGNEKEVIGNIEPAAISRVNEVT